MTRRPPRQPERPSHGDMQSCPGKVPFFSERVAKQRAREIRETDGTDMPAYPCSACSWWHLGHGIGQTTGVLPAVRLFQAPSRKERS